MKERLLGAVILVGVIVTLVPEMLSGPRREAAAARAAADGTVRTYTIDLAAPVAMPKSQATESAQNALEADSGEAVTVAASAASPTANSEPAAPAEEPVAAPAKPEVDTPAVVRREPAALDSGWVVQLGSFASRENAERLAAEVRTAGYRAFVSRFESDKRVRYRVRVPKEKSLR